MPFIESMQFRDFAEGEDAYNHEAGHGAAAKHADRNVPMFITAAKDGSGIAGISTAEFDETSLYRLAVAGYLTEASRRHKAKIDLEQVAGTVDTVVTILKNKLSTRVAVPLQGDKQTEAGFSPDDFDFAKGKINVPLAKDAAIYIAKLINGDQQFNADVDEIYSSLSRRGSYRSGF